MKNKGLTILSIITNIILIAMLCSFIRINGGIVKEKQIIKEMSESTQVTDLNNQINALNTEHTEYMNYIQTCKVQLASAITDMGIETSENASIDTMVINIRSISGASSTDTVKYLLKEGEIVSDDLKSITVTSGSYSSNEDSIGKNLFVNTTSAAICFKIDLTNYTKLILACRCDSGNNQFNTKVNTSPMNSEQINNTGSCLDVSSYTGEYYICAYYNNGKIHVYDILGL